MGLLARLAKRDVWLFVATVVFLVAAIVSAVQMYRVGSALIASIRTGNWLVVEANAEFHNTLSASKSFRLDPTAAQLDELKLRFDVFWSRVPLIIDSAEGEAVRRIPVVLANAQKVEAALPALDDALTRAVIGDPASAVPFEAMLEQLEPAMEEMVRVLLIQDEARYRLEALGPATIVSGGMFILAVLAGFALAIGNQIQRSRLQKLFQQQVAIDQARATQLTAIESSGEGIAMFDAMGQLRYSNEAFHHLIDDDFTRTLTRESWRRFLMPDAVRAILRGLRATPLGQSWKGEVHGRTLKGEQRDWEVAITRSKEGDFVALFRDLAERKATERERAEIQEQMHRVEKMDAVGRLAGGVAHDFNNILAAIAGFGALLQLDLENQPEQRAMVDQILIAAGRGKELVQSIMTFSRAEKAERRTTDVAAACREAATMAAMSIEGPAVLETQISSEPMPVLANATQITRAIVNLCINARDALQNNRGTIRLEVARVEIDGGRSAGLRGAAADNPKAGESVVRFEEVAPDHARGWIGTLTRAGPHVRIRVSDQGSGIPLTVMERIFDPFFTTKEVGRGTGLGLSSVLGIVSAHGGAIAIDSVVGKGTVFDLLLPIEASEEHAAEAGTAAEQSGNIAGARVLVVDDDVAANAALVGILERIGCEPSSCGSGREALELLTDEPDLFDVVITDFNMPEMSGIELAAALRDQSYRKPIVLVTGRAQDAVPADRAKFGIDLVLAKPFSLRDVAGVIWSVMNRTPVDSGAENPTREEAKPAPAA